MCEVRQLEAHIAHLETELASLREHERDLIDFLENAPVGLCWLDAAGTILWANQFELEILGFTAPEYAGHNIAEFHADAPVLQDILRRLANQEPFRNLEARLRGKDGAIRHVLLNSSVRRNANGEFVHIRCSSRDITARKRYEQRLATQNGVARILSQASSLPDAAPGLLELIGRQLNCAAGLLWTYHEDETCLRPSFNWELSPNPDGSFAAMTRQFTFAPGAGLPGRIWESQLPAWVPDLQRDANFLHSSLAAKHGLRSSFGFPIVLGGRVLNVMEFFADEVRAPDGDLVSMAAALGYQIGEFHERTRAQSLLAERKESFRVLAETAPDGIITMDANGVILFANAAAARMFGYASEELPGSDLSLLVPEPDRAARKEILDGYLKSGRRGAQCHVVPFTGQHRHGHEIPLEVSCGEYFQGDQRVFVGVVRDITARKRLDESLRQAAKLESLGVLAGGIAHDFNNLLTGILGNISLVMETLDDDNPFKTNLCDAADASEHAAHLTKQLLAYAGKGRFLIEPVNVSELVRQINSLVKSAIPEHVTVRLDLEPSLPPVEADVAQLQQLLMNLVINAAEAIPPDREGAVLVMTRSHTIEAGLEADELLPGHYLAISVHDNGMGMDEATLSRIFDPFFTTKFTGRGLGLAAAVGIVRSHKGTLKVFSAPGEGTTFRVLLPAAAAGVRNKAVAAAPLTDPAGAGTVLVVDDEPAVRKAAASSLKRYGYTVVTADDGHGAVQRFRENHSRLAAVVLDMTMPVMSGEEVLGHLQAIDPSVPVILSSGYSEIEAIRRFTGKGLAGFIQKPYTALALAAKIRTVLDGTPDRSRNSKTPRG